MQTETIRAILAHHEETVASLNKTIRDREIELALVIKELQELRDKHAQLLAFRGEKIVPTDKTVPLEGVASAVRAKRT